MKKLYFALIALAISISVQAQVITIAAAKARPLLDTVTIRGVVSMGPMGGNTRFIYDQTAGIGLFTPVATTTFNYNVGDSVEVRGIRGAFRCMPQLSPVLSHSLISSNRPIRVFNYNVSNIGAAFLDSNLGRVVRISGITSLTTVQGEPVTTFEVSGNDNYRLNGIEFRELRILAGAEIAGQSVPGRFNVTGAVGLFSRDCATGTGYQLIPRTSSDIERIFNVAFTNPANNQILTVDSGATINFTVAITDAPGTIDSVVYSIDGEAPIAVRTVPFSLPISFGATTIAPVEAIATAYSGAARATATTTFSVVLSANARLAQELKMFPNPANNKFVVKSGSLAIEKISVISVTGKQLINVAGSDINEVNISPLPTGYYFVKVATNKGVATLKLVKN